MKSFKKLLVLALVLSMVVMTFAACGGGSSDSGEEASADQTYTFKVQCAYPPGDQGYDLHMPMICEMITEATDGAIQWEYYQPGAICEVEQMPTSLSKGLLDAGMMGPNETAALVPAAYAEQGIPFWWTTKEDIYECMYDYGMIDYLREQYAAADIYYGCWNGQGQYSLMTSFPVNSAEDLKGKKIRASTTYASLMQELGASPVQMSGTDLYMGMKLGTIEGYIYSVAELETSSLKEVTKYLMSPAGCAGAPVNFLFSMKAWNSLTPELQEKVNKALEESYLATMDAAAANDEEALAKAKEYGVEVVEVTGDALQGFYDAGDKVLASLEEKYPEAQEGFDILKKWKADKDAKAN